MADVTKPARRGRQRAQEQVEDRAPEVDDESQDEQGADEPRGGEGSEDSGSSVTSELKDTIREAAIEVLKPVARKATTSAAKYAVTKGPDLVKDKVMPKVEEAGGAGALAKGALAKGGAAGGGIGSAVGGLAQKVTGGKGGGDKGGGKKPTGHGRGRRLPVQEYVDVAADIQTVYDQYTQFEDFPQFMHRVEKVEQRDETTLMWHENIWGVRRSWEAEIVEQKPCERIVWRGTGQTQTVGVVTFHRLSDNLTRVYVNLDFQPKGLFEKTASGLRMSRRALRSDLMRFKAWVEMRDEATGAWRGRIEEGEVVESEDGDEAEARGDEEEARGDEEEARGEEQEEPSAEEEDEEPSAEEEDDEGAEYEEEEEEEREQEPAASSDGDEQGYADEDEEDVEEEEEPPAPRPARRRSRASASRPTSGSRRR
jgi:uncharacterized membrane protein